MKAYNSEFEFSSVRGTVSYAIGMALCLVTPSAFLLFAKNDISSSTKTIAATVHEIRTAPCETRPSSPLSAHLVVASEGKILNVHLGPSSASVVKEVLSNVKVGSRLNAIVFRKGNMTENEVIAQSIEINDQQIELRDHQTRPYWSAKKLKGHCS